MTNRKGFYYLCVVENKQITELSKLTPSRMLDLFRYLVKEFGDEDYDNIADMLNYFPVDFKSKNKKLVQMLYVNFNSEHQVVGTGYIVYAYNRKIAEHIMQKYLE